MWKKILTSIIIFLLITACRNQTPSTTTSPPQITSTPRSASSFDEEHFPQKINIPTAFLDTPAIEGELVLENSCLRVNGVKNLPTGDNFLLIWDPRFSTHTAQGVVQVVDSSTGEVLVSVGDSVSIADGGDTIYPTKKPIPDECPGPYWVVGEFIKKIDRP
jgi:hypothetical protein